MSNIINKSNHPVEVKKINVKIWRLRDEIEAGIAQRIKSEGHSDDSPVFIEDIKEYYINILNTDVPTADATGEGDAGEAEDSDLDSSGNPMDDDALEMMAALGGGGDTAETKEDKTEEDKPEVDDEAAALAAEMLGDQGITPDATKSDGAKNNDENEGEEDEAAALAAQMLADQGLGGETEATTTDTEETKSKKELTREAFTRVRPNEDKIVNGFLLLSDVNMDQMMIFAQGTYIHGQNIVVDFLVPKSFSQMLEVSNSVNIGRNSKIISQSRPEYRLQCKFQFKFPGERTELRSFLQSVTPDIPEPPKKLKKPDSDDDDDDFDDLGF